MSSDIEGLLDSLTTDSSSISNTLRRAKILSSKIRFPEFRSWIDCELSGYSSDVEVPSYRSCKTHNFATILDPLGGGIRNLPLSLREFPQDARDGAETLTLRVGVGELGGMANEDGLTDAWPADVVQAVGRVLRITSGQLVDVRKPVPKYFVQGILDNVKNRLLDFLIELQNDADGNSVDSVDQEKVRNSFYTIILGNQNVVNVAEHLRVEQEVRVGDFDSLRKYLQNCGVTDADLTSLKDAISSQSQSRQGEFDAKVSAWLGTMVKKAADGVWKVSVENVGKLLVDALTQFFG